MGSEAEGAIVPRPLCAAADLVAHTPGTARTWHSLKDHSRAVGDLAAEFAEPFDGADIARLAGYLHDAGKATVEVQQRLRAAGMDPGAPRRPLGAPHKAEGAIIAASLVGPGDQRLAVSAYLALHGHHAGIPAWGEGESNNHLRAALAGGDRLAPLRDLMARLVDSDLGTLASRCRLPDHVAGRGTGRDLTSVELFTRMCHSALVDADFLDTSAHFDGRAGAWRAPVHGMQRLRDAFMTSYAAKYDSVADTAINRLRRQIFTACVMAAETARPAGIYRLPAQTGTGKTMASAAFALNHAVRFNKCRVIVAVPFTTITTQNAAAYREMFGPLEGAVLEHHSEIVDDGLVDDTWRRLSAQQWDGEFIVTTTVQLFESLFSNRPSRTRKLHRIVDSVIVLDEVQALPIDLLGPILSRLRELTEHYGVTVLLASATQPSFWELSAWTDLPAYDVLPLDDVPDITQRVSFDVRGEKVTWGEVSAELADESQALAVVNTRRAADELFLELRDSLEGRSEVYLLSRSLTSDHRSRVLEEVRQRLDARRPVHLVSTQLIEAGVDVDFPVVFRAVAPADSIVQAAGRCNRNGLLGARGGRVIVFDPADSVSPSGHYSQMTETTRNHFMNPDRSVPYAFDSPSDLSAYYAEVYARTPHIDARDRDFAAWRRTLDFPRTASEFRMIQDEHTIDVVVVEHPDPFIEQQLDAVLSDLRANPLPLLDRQARRLLSRHSAAVPARIARELTEELPQGVRVWLGAYDARRGAIPGEGLTW